jgi:hypothetical protein
MQHCVAVRTDRPEVVCRIDSAPSLSVSNRANVVYVDELVSDGAIPLLEVEPTHGTREPMNQ